MFDGITNKGSEYLAKCQATGEGIKLVKVKIGDGKILDEEDPTTFIDIKSIKQEVEILEKSQVEDTLRIVMEFNNEDVEMGYFPREIGIYAQDGEKEILYWYINDGDQTSWMPPAEKAPVRFKYGVNIIVTNNETTIINWTGKGLWIDKETFEKEMNKKQNVEDETLLTDNKKIVEAINEVYSKKIDAEKIVNNLTTEEEGYVLDGRQGKILNEKKMDKNLLWETFHKHGDDKNVKGYSNIQFNQLGLCSIYYSGNKNLIDGQPTDYGQLINIPANKNTESTQLWLDQMAGRLFSRKGNGDTPIKDQPFKEFANVEQVNLKFDKAGGTITNDVVMQKDLVVNGTTSTNALILNGWKITIK